MEMDNKPIVYSCTGCSNLALIAHDIALNMDRDGIAEMSCIAGVVGKIKPIVELAHSGRPIFAIDGCELSCTQACLEACQLKTELHFNISAYGLEKGSKLKSSFSEGCIALNRVYDELAQHGYHLSTEDISDEDLSED